MAAPDDRPQIHMGYRTPKGVAPDDRAQIYMDYETPNGVAPDDRVQIYMDYQKGAAPDDSVWIYIDYRTPKRGLSETIQRRSIGAWDSMRGAMPYSSDPYGFCDAEKELRQTIDFRSIWIVGRRRKGSAPDDRVRLYMDYRTPKRGLPETIELRAVWIMERQNRAVPDYTAQIYMEYGILFVGLCHIAQIHMDSVTPKRGCPRR